MSKSPKPDSEPHDQLHEERRQAALEEKVRLMLDPEIESPGAEPPASSTMPGLPNEELPDEPEPGTNSLSKSDETEVPGPPPLTKGEQPAAEGPANEQSPDETLTAGHQPAGEQGDYTAAIKPVTPLATESLPAQPRPTSRMRRIFAKWWRTAWLRNLTLATLMLGVAALLAVPDSRYLVMNTAGIRSSASITVLDDSTQQPLKNVRITLGDSVGTTNDQGEVTFSRLKLGRQTVVFERRAYAGLERSITIGWGSNPLGEFKLSPTGSQYVFKVTDYLSGKPLPGIEASSDEYSAFSNDDGEIKLTMDVAADQSRVAVSLRGEGLRQETIDLDLARAEPVTVAMVPDRPHYFVSRRSGKYDVYQIDIDGRNETRLLEGSGSERDDLVLAPHPVGQYVALVSTRENVRNSQGYLLSTLTLIEPDNNIPLKLAQSERIQIVDWIDDHLIYVLVSDGESAADPNRHQLISYNVRSGETKQLASSNFFNDVISVNRSIYYAPTKAYEADNYGLYKVSADGGGQQKIMGEEAWNILRTDFAKLVIASGRDWYDYGLTDGRLTQLSGQPPDITSRVYVNSADNQRTLWADQRDGQGYLLVLDLATKQETVIHKQAGLQYPVRWLNDRTVVFRLSTNQEIADYALSLDGGEPRKIRDVTDTSGIDKWYYY